MPFMNFDGVPVELPRHVHRESGLSKIVETEDELRRALEEGYVIDPNAATDARASGIEPSPPAPSAAVAGESAPIDVGHEATAPTAEPAAPPRKRRARGEAAKKK